MEEKDKVPVFASKVIVDRIKELEELLRLKEIELKTERESRREEHGKQQEVIKKLQYLNRKLSGSGAVRSIENLHKLFPGHEWDAKPIELSIKDKFDAQEKRIKELEAEEERMANFVYMAGKAANNIISLKERISELEALVKEAWDNGLKSRFSSRPSDLNRNEFLKSKGIEL
jgi:hypothetical protein